MTEEYAARKRILAVYDHEIPDRVPFFAQGLKPGFMANLGRLMDEQMDDWCERTGLEPIFSPELDGAAFLGQDSVYVHVPGPGAHHTFYEPDGQEITIGLNGQLARQETSFYTGGYFSSLDKIEAVFNQIKWPAKEDYRSFAEFVMRVQKNIMPMPCVGGITDTTWQAMGFSQFALALHKRSPVVLKLFELYGNMVYERTRLTLEAFEDVGGSPGILNVLDDIAFKGRAMIRPSLWRELVAPYYEPVTALIHEYHVHAQLHSDGDMTEMIPHLIDVGFEGLQGWEIGAGMDPVYCKQTWPQFVINGFLDQSQVLPFDTEEQVREHVRTIAAILKPGGNWIAGPSTVWTDNVPLQNAFACIDEVHQVGQY
ncbi:MAG TPA: uroporphyrinogen decarboxylase family protein [Candidatus Lokiarchaeia archaeon]|nr:uroporphyrinogen decarboxylase family protein [Candidatus Lokiarchaeia archaeon]